MSLQGNAEATKAFNGLILELRNRDWDLLIDEGSNAFITAVANEYEKWELEVQFHDDLRFSAKSRSRWIVKDESLNRIEKVIGRLNDDNDNSNEKSIWRINKQLRSFEAITEAKRLDDEDFTYFFDAVSENTSYYQAWSDTVRKASVIDVDYDYFNPETTPIPQKNIKN